jgi:hypothetical protein
MSLRIILIASGVIGILFGVLLFFGTESAIQSYNLGDSTLAARLFARGAGAAIFSIAVINLLASSDRGSPALRAIVIGNILIHVLSFATDFSESYARNASVYVSFAIHVIFIVAFGWVLLNWRQLTSERT